MIKERKKKTKYNFKKSKKRIFLEYLRTIFFSLVFAIILTSCLAIQARNEMIKNIYASAEQQRSLDKATALRLISESNLLENLQTKKYSVCMHIGELYETAGDYKDAQIVYEHAVLKAKPGVYKPYYRLICVLIEQENFKQAIALLENIKDITDKKLVKFKTRSYLTIGDKYYSIGKFLSAAKSYEKADFYYSKFAKKDEVIVDSIKNRIISSYIQVADIMVKTGLNSEAVRFLRKAEQYDKDNFKIRYKLAIILADSDPEKSVEYFESLLEEIPQDIDYGVYGIALMKAANIADLDNRPTKAKYYRYKIHSLDLFINRKVVYKNDIETNVESFIVKKVMFTYPLKAVFSFANVSSVDLINLTGDFVLSQNGKKVETITIPIATKSKPLYSNGYNKNPIEVKFKKALFTKKELENYTIKIYLYKDERFKTLVCETKIPRQDGVSQSVPYVFDSLNLPGEDD